MSIYLSLDNNPMKIFHSSFFFFLDRIESFADIPKDIVDGTFGRNDAGLFFVRFNDRLGMLVERVEPFLDGLNVVVDTSGRLATLQETLSHGLVFHIEVEDFGARSDLFLEFLTLSHFTRIAINEETFGSGQFANHSLSQEVKNNKERNQFSFFHHLI